ncbi:hypothetical protein B0J13DRAFT_447440 [Dactylonectria estremocensis]|uniref:F-box domain-containing protein n=1 Tax=Dactylonectria estremocensis TaxID=1079267 RepID=A0A9P9ELW3_9HYPO|nr:hypothetical protein B0J13DRAFT_447440 [Dactylonectria estremocensis]
MTCSCGLEDLPLHLLYIICSFSSKASVIQLRLTSLALNRAATPWAFRHVRLECSVQDTKRFAWIAKSPGLRRWVHEISCDTWTDRYWGTGSDSMREDAASFLNTLSYLQYFHHLKSLHLRFNAHSGESTRNTWSCNIEETWDFRFQVLDVLFQCLAGTWPRNIQEQLRSVSAHDLGTVDATPDNELNFFKTQPICLKTLTIANLAAYEEQRLVNSEAFKKVLSSPTLTDLKLYISPENDELSPEVSLGYPEPHEFFLTLPHTWLAPCLAQNLSVLSLYCRDPWGWCPKMDFRAVNPGQGSNSGFPFLKVLALGNYTFSHEWQIEWIASLGQKNESGGLEELYLDDCPILYEACQLAPMDEGETTLEVITQGQNNHDAHQTQTEQYPLRWYMLLRHWKDAMKGLRVFRMGRGEWHRTPVDTFRACAGQFSRPLRSKDKFVLEHLLMDKEFTSFGCPEPSEPAGPAPADDFYQHGTGLRRERIDLMKYFRYRCGKWTESQREQNSFFDNREVWAPEKETIAKDTAAYNMLLSVVQLRHGPEHTLV